MGGSPKGGPQSSHLKPIMSTDDPRYKKLAEGRERYQRRQREAKERRHKYSQMLREVQQESYQMAKSRIDDGEVQDPLSIVQEMIEQQQLVLSAMDPSKNENMYYKEKELLMKLNAQYADMLGASKTKEDESTSEELSAADALEILKKIASK